MTRLASVPQPISRDGIYIRVSAVMGRADDRFLSPDLQREAIDRTRGREGPSRLVDVWSDIDVSTRRTMANRPGLQAALTAARDGSIDRLWFLTLDRFDRDTGALKVFDEIAALGVELWTEGGRVDIESPEGLLSTTMQLAIARYQRDRIGKSWRATHRHRLERGLPHSGKARFGYVYDLEQRLHIPDPVTGPALAEVYRRYTAGESIYALVRWLNDQGITTTEGNPWRDRVLRRCLDSGFAAGILTYGERAYPGAHTPLITEAEWAAYSESRGARRTNTNTERSQYVLSGLVRCGHCGAAMVAGQYGANHAPKYRCSAGKEAGAHSGGYVMAHYVEASVVEWLRGVADDIEGAIDLAAAASARQARSDLDAAQAKVEELARQSQALVRHLLEERITEGEYDAAAADLRARQDEAAQLVVQLLAATTAPLVDPSRVVVDLLEDWDVLGVPQRREALRRLIRQVTVWSGRPRARIEVVPAWESGGHEG